MDKERKQVKNKDVTVMPPSIRKHVAYLPQRHHAPSVNVCSASWCDASMALLVLRTNYVQRPEPIYDSRQEEYAAFVDKERKQVRNKDVTVMPPSIRKHVADLLQRHHAHSVNGCGDFCCDATMALLVARTNYVLRPEPI